MANIPAFVDGTAVHQTDLSYLLTPPQAAVMLNVAPAGFATATQTVVNWDNRPVDKDPTSWAAGAPSQLSCNTPGMWMWVATLQWVANATGYRWVQIRKNSGGLANGGTAVISDTRAGVATIPLVQSAVGWSLMAAGDYVEVFGAQASGGALALTGGNVCSLAAFWMGQS